MDDLSVEADAESDAVFTPERLRAQQQQILRRIEHVGRPARVISFPSHVPADRASTGLLTRRRAGLPPRPPPDSSWASALGATIEWQRHARQASSHRASLWPRVRTDAPANALPAASPAPAATELVATPAPEAVGDDAFLSDLEVALERTQTRELRAIDALTPHVREIRDVRYVR